MAGQSAIGAEPIGEICNGGAVDPEPGALHRLSPFPLRLWANSRYAVTSAELPNGITHLSIKRRRKSHVHDWRELLRVKNELTDPDREALEIYPGMWRVVDTVNQYHLYVLPAGVVLNLGFLHGHVEDEAPDRFEENAPRQRPLPDWMERTPEGQRHHVTTPMATGSDGEGGIELVTWLPEE